MEGENVLAIGAPSSWGFFSLAGPLAGYPMVVSVVELVKYSVGPFWEVHGWCGGVMAVAGVPAMELCVRSESSQRASWTKWTP